MVLGRRVWTTMFLLPVLGLAAGAQAGSVGYQFRIAGNKNVPIFRLTNKSTSANITSFTMTVGDASYNFDFHRPHPLLTKPNPTVGSSFATPDLLQGSSRSNTLSVSYTDFQPGEFHRFKTDIDPDSYNKRINYQKILFDLGGSSSADNAQLTVRFSSGDTLSGYLPDFAGPNHGNKFVYGQSLSLSGGNPTDGPGPHAAPLPAGLWAGLSLLGTLSAWRGTKRIVRGT